MAIHKSKHGRQPRYFLLTAGMLISEEVSRALIAKNAEDAREKTIDDFITQNFLNWNVVGQDIKSGTELTNIRELTKQEYDDYMASH
jgi:hypothetical protein